MDRERIRALANNVEHDVVDDTGPEMPINAAAEIAINTALSEREQEIIAWLEQQPAGSGKYLAERLMGHPIGGRRNDERQRQRGR